LCRAFPAFDPWIMPARKKVLMGFTDFSLSLPLLSPSAQSGEGTQRG
jgi:hypothetical protein